jgi:hypothetical protein
MPHLRPSSAQKEGRHGVANRHYRSVSLLTPLPEGNICRASRRAPGHFKTGPSAILGAERLQVGPAMRDTGRRRAGHRNLGDVRAAERRLDDSSDGGTEDAVRAGIFRVHRRIVDRLPCGIASRRRVAVDIAIADRGDRPPELVFVFASNTATSASPSPTATSAMNRALSSTLICLAVTSWRATG